LRARDSPARPCLRSKPFRPWVRQVREPQAAVFPEDVPHLEAIERIAAEPSPSVTSAILAHPLVEETRSVLNQSSSRPGEKLSASRELKWLDLRVTKNYLSRALRIMAALIQMLEKEGFQVVVEKKANESTRAVIYRENIRFGLIERFHQVKPAPKPNASTYSYNPVRLETTGELSIEVWNYYSGGPQKVWRDRENSKLETQIPKCVAGMMRIGATAGQSSFILKHFSFLQFRSAPKSVSVYGSPS
jgi:hypothetical protein